MSPAPFWTAAEEAKLVSMHKAGVSVREIARSLGRGFGATQKRVKTLREDGQDIAIRRQPEPTQDEADNARAALGCEKHLLDLLRSGKRRWTSEARI